MMNSGRLTVLAVDDEQTQLEDLARLLRGFPSVEEVECADGGQDALVKASAQPFDAIFLDVRMPDLAGLKLARERDLLKPQEPAVAVLTGTGLKTIYDPSVVVRP